MKEITVPEYVRTALEALESKGFSAYTVGGAVRDSILGLPVSDWDITTSASPEETEEVFEGFRVIETGIRHGTVTVIVDSNPIEITTMRIDGDYTDNRRPDSVEFTDDIAADLSRRDFTVNAIAYSPVRGLADPFGGVDDIRRKVIRCVGNADRRFQEDSLRIMRALRFGCLPGFTIEKETSESLVRNRALLKNIAGERIFRELSKLLCTDKAPGILREYRDIFFEIMPQLAPMYGCPQNTPFHRFDVWEHTLHCIEYSPQTPEIRFAALLHDSGKPACRVTDTNGTDHFKSHGPESKKIAHVILSYLKVSNSFMNDVETLTEYHDISSELMEEAEFKRWLGILGERYFTLLFDIKRADIKAKSEMCFYRLELIDKAEKKMHEILDRGDCLTVSRLKISGNDLIREGFSGPGIGEELNIILDAVLSGRIENRKEAILKFIKTQNSLTE